MINAFAQAVWRLCGLLPGNRGVAASLLMTAAFAGLSGQYAYAAETVLENVDITNLPGSRVQIRFQLSQPAAEPEVFTINDPARIVLDFRDARNGLSARRYTIGSGVAERLDVLEGSGRTRASVNLARLIPYTLVTQGDSVVLTLEAAGGAVTPTQVSPVFDTTVPTQGRTLSNIDFRRGPQGEGIINIMLSDPGVAVDVREEGDRIVADFLGATLPRGQERRLDVTDFATPILLVDALNEDGNARIVVQPTGDYEYLAYQTNNVYTIEVKPVIEIVEETDDPRRERTYSGELLSLNFQDISVRAVLQIIADFTGQNVVVSDTVEGNLTLRLQNVPWDQALDIILRTKGLTQRQNGNVIYIAPTEEVTARERLELEARRTITELVPTRSEIIQVNYAKVEDVQRLIDSRTQQGQEGRGGLLSPRGQVSIDSRTNTLLIQDIPEKISEIRSLVTRLDVPVRQVMVDSRVVIANDDFTRELGVRYGFTGVRRNGDNGVATTSGGLSATDDIVNEASNNLQNTGQPFPVGIPNLAERLGVNLATPNLPFGRLALAILGKDYLLDLELSALQAEGRGEILSNPRVVTTDRATAVIKQGQEIPYQVVEDGTVTVQFREAVLELEVTPQITPDNRIIMDLVVRKNDRAVGQDLETITGPVPIIAKREVETQVLVNNGETVVLGGVFEQVTSDNIDKIPLLGDLPAVGRLFQRRTNLDTKLELLIFVTPQVITEGIAAR